MAGAYFAAGPHRWTRLSHLHAQVTVFLPLALLLLDRFWERRTLRRALAVGLALAFQGLASIYLGAITAAALAVAVAVALFGGLKARELARLAAGFLLAAAILWPVMRPYLRMRAFQGQEFTLETVSTYAASLPSYAAAGTTAWGWLSQRLLDPSLVRDTLFPGVVALALGVIGLAAAPRRYRAVAVAASLVAVVFSLGPDTALYRFLHEHVVLVRGVRALARFALVPTLALAVLAGLALSGRRRIVGLAALVLMMAESANLPLRLERYDGPSPAARWLAGKDGAVLVLPLAENDTLAMLDGLAHGRPLVNGDSGFIPRPFDRAMELLERGVGDEGLRFLRAVGVRHVVAPESGRGQAGELALEGLTPVAEAGRRARPRGDARPGRTGCGGRPSGEHPVDARRSRPRVPGAANDRPGGVRALGRPLGGPSVRRGVSRRSRLGAGRGLGEPGRRHPLALPRPAPRPRRGPLRPPRGGPLPAPRPGPPRSRRRARGRRVVYPGPASGTSLVVGKVPCQNTAMENRYTGVFEQVGDWWIGHVEELPGCNVQERSLDEARESLKEAVQLIVQANRELARRESEGHEVVREALAVAVE